MACPTRRVNEDGCSADTVAKHAGKPASKGCGLSSQPRGRRIMCSMARAVKVLTFPPRAMQPRRRGVITLPNAFACASAVMSPLISRTLLVFLALLGAILLVMPMLARTHLGAALCMLVFGVVSFALVPAAQLRVMHAAADAPGLASSVNVGAFNLGNAVGAAAGSAIIDAGLGYAFVPIAGSLAAVFGIALILWSRRVRAYA